MNNRREAVVASLHVTNIAEASLVSAVARQMILEWSRLFYRYVDSEIRLSQRHVRDDVGLRDVASCHREQHNAYGEIAHSVNGCPVQQEMLINAAATAHARIDAGIVGDRTPRWRRRMHEMIISD